MACQASFHSIRLLKMLTYRLDVGWMLITFLIYQLTIVNMQHLITNWSQSRVMRNDDDRRTMLATHIL